MKPGKNVETESEIDGELVSKVSKAHLIGGVSNQYPGEVVQTGMNEEQLNELD